MMVMRSTRPVRDERARHADSERVLYELQRRDAKTVQVSALKNLRKEYDMASCDADQVTNV